MRRQPNPHLTDKVGSLNKCLTLGDKMCLLLLDHNGEVLKVAITCLKSFQSDNLGMRRTAFEFLTKSLELNK